MTTLKITHYVSHSEAEKKNLHLDRMAAAGLEDLVWKRQRHLERNGRQHFVKADHFINAECTSAAGRARRSAPIKKRAAILEKDIIAFSMRSMCS